MDYSNSRGAVDMGVTPELLPGYKPSGQPGMHLQEMIEADLNVLWVVGANPYAGAATAAKRAGFLVVQDMFLTETAKLADVVLPSASALRKRHGTITNGTGGSAAFEKSHQCHSWARKADLEIMWISGARYGRGSGAGPVWWLTWCSKRSASTCAGTIFRFR